MSLTQPHQIAFRTLSKAMADRAEAAKDPAAYEVLLGIADALDDAANALHQRDMANYELLDRRQPQEKSK